MANRPFDLWSQIYFLDGGESLGTDFHYFRRHLDLSNDLWAEASKRNQFEAELAGVFDKIRPFTVRRTKDNAGIELPEKDRPILLAAIACQATHLLTADKQHFGAHFGKTIEGVLVLPPDQFLKSRSHGS